MLDLSAIISVIPIVIRLIEAESMYFVFSHTALQHEGTRRTFLAKMCQMNGLATIIVRLLELESKTSAASRVAMPSLGVIVPIPERPIRASTAGSFAAIPASRHAPHRIMITGIPPHRSRRSIASVAALAAA